MKSCSGCQAAVEDGSKFCLECGLTLDEAPDQKSDPWAGRLIAGRFQIIRKIGSGGMGEVFVAEQQPMGRRVALKVLRSSLSDDAQHVERFKREAQAASRLTHPNTITVHDFGQGQDGTVFLAMEMLEGQTLAEVIESGGALEPARVVRIMSQVCGSLGEAHEQGMVHRDLKPENIFLANRAGKTDFVKVLDFGIVKVLQDDAGGKLQTLTQAGAIFGTPQYMSPEQIKGGDVDARSDIYALGIIVYQMLSGHLPFAASTAVEMLTKHLSEQPPPMTVRSADLKADLATMSRLESVALRALAKNRDGRQSSAKAFQDELEQALAGRASMVAKASPKPPVVASKADVSPQATAKWPWIAGLIGLVSVAAAALLLKGPSETSNADVFTTALPPSMLAPSLAPSMLTPSGAPSVVVVPPSDPALESAAAEAERNAAALESAPPTVEGEAAVIEAERARLTALEAQAAERLRVGTEAERLAALEARRLEAQVAAAQAVSERVVAEKALAEAQARLLALEGDRATAEAEAAEVQERRSEADARAKAARERRPPAAVRYGRLFVSSRTAGVRVTVDGRLRGKTPLKNVSLAPGRHVVVGDLKGKKESKSIEVRPNGVVTIRLGL